MDESRLHDVSVEVNPRVKKPEPLVVTTSAALNKFSYRHPWGQIPRHRPAACVFSNGVERVA
jgi:hypothetical protein